MGRAEFDRSFALRRLLDAAEGGDVGALAIANDCGGIELLRVAVADDAHFPWGPGIHAPGCPTPDGCSKGFWHGCPTCDPDVRRLGKRAQT